MGGAPPGIEPGTSCTQSKNHTTRPRCQIHRPGIEPESQAWKANMLTTTPTMFELKKYILKGFAEI